MTSRAFAVLRETARPWYDLQSQTQLYRSSVKFIPEFTPRPVWRAAPLRRFRRLFDKSPSGIDVAPRLPTTGISALSRRRGVLARVLTQATPVRAPEDPDE